MKVLFYLIILICISALAAIAQPPPPPVAAPGSKPVAKIELPSLAKLGPEDKYRSWEGRFTIDLPRNGLRGFAAITPETSGGINAGGSYDFKVKEGEFNIQYVDRTDGAFSRLTAPQIAQFFPTVMETTLKRVGGTRIAEEPRTLGSIPGRIMKVKTADGALMTAVTYLEGNRFYVVVAMIDVTAPKATALIEKAVESFRIQPQAEIDAEVVVAIKSATPPALPQTPVTPKEKSDAADDNLKGRVRIVLEESQDLSGTWQNQERHRSSEEEFNEAGNLVRRISYDSNGYPHSVAVFGYIDGDRVSVSKSVDVGNRFTISAAGPGSTKPRDTRYNEKRLYKYKAGRMSEMSLIQNNGDLWMRYVYNHSGSEMTALIYSSNGKLNQKYWYGYDSLGNVVNYRTYEALVDPEKVRGTYRYSYDKLDEKGNWTQRTQYKIVTENGAEKEKPSQIEYRTITYYP